MTPLDAADPTTLAPEATQATLLPSDTLEKALRAFDASGEEVLPVVAASDRTKIVGWASQVAALSWFNKALIETSVEEHR
jgi:CIC family chloride channel protein